MMQIILQQSIHLLLSLFQFNYFRITDGTDKSPMEDHRWRRWADDADYLQRLLPSPAFTLFLQVRIADDRNGADGQMTQIFLQLSMHDPVLTLSVQLF
jgi:hypothetical protein